VSALTIVANIHANPDQIDVVKAALETLVPVTRGEEGCVRYDLHCDNKNPAHFMFYETWESRALWQVHRNTPHIKAFQEATAGAIADFTLSEVTQIA